jgi:hypothetical protein
MTIRPYADRTEQGLRDVIRSLEEVGATGVASISHNGETTTFRSPDSIERALVPASRGVAFLTSPETARAAPALRVVYPRYCRGLFKAPGLATRTF